MHRDLSPLLTRAELDAERLVSLLRMAVAAGLLTFLWLAASPSEGEAAAHPLLRRQWLYAVATILAYFLLGFGVWLMGRRGRLRPWMIWPMATADVLFLLASVGVSMDNTGILGDAVFALPSMWLVPIVLSFGALRGNPRIMAFTVVLVGLGVAGLISVEMGQSRGQGQDPIWLFLSPPPNVIRLVMILLAGIVLWVAAYRTRGLVHQAVAAARRTANLTRYLPEQLAPRLADGEFEALRQGRRQQMVVLFIDMRGFTRWSETRPAQEISDLIGAYRGLIAQVADAHGGMIDKFMGDAAMIVFEAASPEAAARAGLSCAEQLLHQMAHWSAPGGTPVQVGIGAHWGTVFCGVVGQGRRLEYSVFGDVVNVAARLEQMTKSLPADLIVSQDLLRAAGMGTGQAVAHWQSLGEVSVPGRAGVLAVFGQQAAVVSDQRRGPADHV